EIEPDEVEGGADPGDRGDHVQPAGEEVEPVGRIGAEREWQHRPVANPNALVCPDKFRGTLTAQEAAAAIAAGLHAAGFACVRELPLADGGEGTLDVLLAALGGQRRTASVTGPDGSRVEAEWGLLPDGRAVVEMALASGLSLLRGRNDPVAATTRGTGELIAAAARAGASEVILGVGGSATTDGGPDAVEALGWSLPVPVTAA